MNDRYSAVYYLTIGIWLSAWSEEIQARGRGDEALLHPATGPSPCCASSPAPLRSPSTRVSARPQVTAGNFGQLLSTGRLLVIAVAEEDPVRRIPAADQKFRDMVQAVAIDTADKYSW